MNHVVKFVRLVLVVLVALSVARDSIVHRIDGPRRPVAQDVEWFYTVEDLCAAMRVVAGDVEQHLAACRPEILRPVLRGSWNF
jgi:hypothetical protein